MRRLLPMAMLAPGLFAVLLANPARGGLVPFEFQPTPIIFGPNGTLTYSAGTQAFHAEVQPLTFTSPIAAGGFAFIDNGNTIIDLMVDNSGQFAANGSGVVITGDIDIDGDGIADVVGTGADPLLRGSITAFGSEDAGPPSLSFNGLFDITGGLLTQMITLSSDNSQVFGGFPVGNLGAFLFTAEDVVGGILGDFSQDFSSSSGKVQYGLRAVPEPHAAVLSLSGGIILVGSTMTRRGRRRPRINP